MKEKILQVKLNDDFMKRVLSVRKPVLALSELIWNGLDADATQVQVHLVHNELGGLEKILVEDDGHGFSFAEADEAFSNLGGSKKRNQSSSREGRRLHGRAGRGRFRPLHLGQVVTWKSVYKEDAELKHCKIVADHSRVQEFRLRDLGASTADRTGVVVSIEGIMKNFSSLERRKAIPEITSEFAPYLAQYPDVSINYDGERIAPDSLKKSTKSYHLSAEVEGQTIAFELEIVEWTEPFDREIILCDSSGIGLGFVPVQVQAPGFQFTAYLKSSYIRKLHDNEQLFEMEPELEPLLDISREQIKSHFRTVKKKQTSDTIEGWKSEGVYPYSGDPVDNIGRSERRVFDMIALTVDEYLPDFPELGSESKTLMFQLLRRGLEHEATETTQILHEVLKLPERRIKELHRLLARTSLSNVINVANKISDRLDFLKGFEALIYDYKKVTKERAHIQKLLEENTWLFGEQYSLVVGDESLDTLLKKHLKILRKEPQDQNIEVPVEIAGKSTGIVDLMISRLLPNPHQEEREHLVVELKRPWVKISGDVLNQLEKYMISVIEDERFADTKTTWSFWAVSNELDKVAKRKARQNDRRRGLVHDDERAKLWVKSWGELLEENRARLEFLSKELEVEHSKSTGLRYLRETYQKYLPEELREESVEALLQVPMELASRDT